MNLKNKLKNFLKYKLKLKHPRTYLYEFKKDRKLKSDKKKYKEKYSSIDILEKLISAGLKKGDTIFIHSSWDNFFNYVGTPKELIETILDYIGENGTLVMPCFPAKQDGSEIFDVKRTPSAAGFLTEIFRRYKNTKRSININHSVCAYGKNAEFLTKDHHLSLTSWDENSPYYRLKYLDALIVGLGVGHDLRVATSLHCVESVLRDKIYFYSLLFPSSVTYKYRDINGNIGVHKFLKRVGDIDTRKISKYFSKNELIEFKISNLDVYCIRANLLIDRSIELGGGGVTMYVNPKPKKKLFYKIDNGDSCENFNSKQ